MTVHTVRLELIAPCALEAEVIDWISEHAPSDPLLVVNVRGYNDASRPMTVAEQVEGTLPMIRLNLTTDEATAQRVLAALTTDFSGSGIRWCLFPLTTGVV